MNMNVAISENSPEKFFSTWMSFVIFHISDHLKNCHPKLEWGDNSLGGNYEEKTMKQAIIWMLLSANRNNVATENV